MWRVVLELLRLRTPPRNETWRTLHWNPQPDITVWELSRAIPFLKNFGEDMDASAEDIMAAIPLDLHRHFYLTESFWYINPYGKRIFLNRTPCFIFEYQCATRTYKPDRADIEFYKKSVSEWPHEGAQ